MFQFSVKSKIFKNSMKTDWFNARIFVDTENKELHFSNPIELDEVEYETGEGKEEEKIPIIEPSVVKLSEFKQPKKKTSKKENGKHSLEFNSKGLLGGKNLRLRSCDASTFQEFCEVIFPLFADIKANKVSIIDDVESACGDYATVSNDHETVQDEFGEMAMVQSKIYEPFDDHLSFSVELLENEKLNEILQRLQLNKEDQLHLYLDSEELQLLGNDLCLVCSWYYYQIIELRYNQSVLKLSIGPRTKTGELTLNLQIESLQLISLLAGKLQQQQQQFRGQNQRQHSSDLSIECNPYYGNADSPRSSHRAKSLQSSTSDDYYTSVKKSHCDTNPDANSDTDTFTRGSQVQHRHSSPSSCPRQQAKSMILVSNNASSNNAEPAAAAAACAASPSDANSDCSDSNSPESTAAAASVARKFQSVAASSVTTFGGNNQVNYRPASLGEGFSDLY